MSEILSVEPVSTEQKRATSDTLAAVKARVKAAETSPKPVDAPASTDASPGQAQEVPPIQAAKAPDVDKADGLQKFRNKDGQVSEDKILKSNEHLQKAIAEKESLLAMSREDRQALLVKQNKELNKKFTQMAQEVAKDKPAEKFNPLAGVVPDELSTEMKQELLARLEKGEVIEVMSQLAKAYGQMAADQKVNQRMSKWEQAEAELAEKASGKQLDSLVEKGHTWILTEGMGRFDAVFQEHPELRQLNDPFRAALGYMDDLPLNGSATGSAQARSSTPILGAGGALPPPSSAPLTSPEQEMEKLSADLKVMLQRGNRAEANKIAAKLDKLQRGF